mmetsp:Transcript_5298/g.8928  ORF Transcript_5298/g.8928 Transcript_5298/m.8928 type:complete len:295 (+) Transcript_5298:843-1727(+)
MHKIPRELKWMDVKYGKLMQPYECTVKFLNIEGNNFGQWKEGSVNQLHYGFCKKNDVKGECVWEREPLRTFVIQDPSKYRGQLGAQKSTFWHNTDRVFVVNGNCTKADGNFVGAFYFRRLGESGITVGSFPQNEMEIHQMRDAGVTAVLDIQTGTDYRQRGYVMERMLRFYKSVGINLVLNFPVSDVREEEYIDQLFQACMHLHDMIDVKGHHVYLHCSTGVSRAPTLALVYLALFLKHKHWNNLGELQRYIRHIYYPSMANLKIAQMVIDKHRDFQSRQKLNYVDEEERRKKA